MDVKDLYVTSWGTSVWSFLIHGNIYQAARVPSFHPWPTKNSQATLGVEVISKLVANNWSSSLEAS